VVECPSPLKECRAQTARGSAGLPYTFQVVTSWLRVGAATIGLASCLTAGPVWGQEPPRLGTSQPQREGESERPPALPLPGPISVYPVELLGLLAVQTQRGPITLVPSISVSEEYNDNLFSDNNNRQADFITGFNPGLTLLVNRPNFELSAGYSFSAEIYAKETSFSGPFNRQTFLGTSLYRVSPRLTFSLADAFLYDRNGNITTQGPTGRQESWTNTFTPAMAWQMTPRSSLNLNATYAAVRFPGNGTGVDSDSYGFQTALGYTFTPRFTGTLGYGFNYLDFKQGDDSITHTPAVGFVYRLTPTLTGIVTGGPAITEIGGRTSVSPAGTVSLTQTFLWGSASVQYTRSVGTGGFGGTNDTQAASGTLAVVALRGLTLAFTPTYTTSDSVNSQQGGQVDVQTFTLGLSALYQISRFVSVFAGYNFLHQRTGGSSSEQANIDQNRARVGVQFGYPINFD
jgi:hypothetical protein